MAGCAPRTRWATTVDGASIAYQEVGEGEIPLAWLMAGFRTQKCCESSRLGSPIWGAGRVADNRPAEPAPNLTAGPPAQTDSGTRSTSPPTPDEHLLDHGRGLPSRMRRRPSSPPRRPGTFGISPRPTGVTPLDVDRQSLAWARTAAPGRGPARVTGAFRLASCRRHTASENTVGSCLLRSSRRPAPKLAPSWPSVCRGSGAGWLPRLGAVCAPPPTRPTASGTPSPLAIHQASPPSAGWRPDVPLGRLST